MLPLKYLGTFTVLALVLFSGSANGVDGLSCLKCKGDCEIAEYTTCPSSETHCFTKYDERASVIEMGCRSDYNENQILDNFKDFFFCEGDNCNDYGQIPDDGQCAVCSSASDENCANNPKKLGNNRCSKAPHKECYSRLTPNGLVERGCASNLEPEDFKNCFLKNDETCTVCSEPGCNKNEISTVAKISCFSCNASEDNCEIPEAKTCEQETTGCFTKFDSRSDIVEMGCKGVYSEQEVLNNLKSFLECEGDKCNDLKNIPNDGSCKVCDSTSDPDCIKNPGKLSDSLCGKPPHTSCYARLTEQNTVERGCTSNLDDSHFKDCVLKNDKNCFICSEKGCNIDDIKPADVAEDLVGVWQDLPVNCYHCKGDSCGPNGNWILRSCSENKYQTCSTVFGLTGEVIERGCSDTVQQSQADYCSTNPEKCLKCKSNGCNTFADASKLVECLSCDVNGDCSKTTQCDGKCMVAINPLTNGIYRGCLNDKELDDQDDCGVDGTCKACEGALCNDFDLEPIDGLSCNTCNDGDCEFPVSKRCDKQTEENKCFMRFDNTASVVEMGCTSQVDAEELEKNYKDYFVCEGDVCNKYENLPFDGQCADCNSLIDPTCATKPSSLKTRRCGLLPHTGCYSLINSEGHTVRGCLSNLDHEQFSKCVLGKDKNCEVCEGTEGCNREVVPANRTQCNRCSSSDKSECERNGVDLSVCPIYVEGDVCVTKYENGVTSRGCGSEINCGSGESENTCKTCEGNGCNDVNLAALQGKDGIVGLWQDLPVNCEHCKGDNCKDESKWTLKSCLGNKYQTCSTVFGESGDVIERGCSDTVAASQSDFCASNPSKCINCKSNGCNNFEKENDLIDCYTCDITGNCDSKTVKCFEKCMVAKNPLTGETYRGCLNDKDLDDRVNCDKDNTCKTCNTELCNTFDLDQVPATGTTCFTCPGNQCENTVPKQCNSVDADQCYTLVDDSLSVISMGCKSDLSDDYISSEIKAKRLYLCDGDNCNNYENLTKDKKCLQCNSLNDPGCATFGVGEVTSCRTLPYFECFKRVLPNGHTERGCLSNLDGDEFLTCLNNENGNCQSCLGDQCNDGLVPNNRLQCYRCNSNDDETCATEATLSGSCVKHVENDVCVSKLSSDGSAFRGCQSDVTCEESDTCKTCNGNNCNTDILTPASSFSCNVCEGDCESVSQNQCANSVENEQCYIRLDDQQSVSKMGCKSDLDENEIDENLNKYIFCDGENCNDFSLIVMNSCVSCNSNDNEDCAISPNSLAESKKCTNLANTKCYARITESGHTERGCVGELDLENYKNCLGGLLCEICDGESCNKTPYPTNRQECLICDSASDPGCLENPLTKKMCPVYNENQVCVSKVTSGEGIIRGCSEEVKCENDSLYDCEICTTNSCNKAKLLNLRSIGKPGAWQPLPLTCLQCEGEECSSTPKENVCQGDIEQNCVSVFSGDKVISRGCTADVYGQHIDHCRNNPGSCHECKSNKCNDLSSKATLKSCLSCASSTDPNCAENIDLITSYRQCSGKCMTALHPLTDDENPRFEIVRSCLNDKDSDDAEACNDNKCKACEGDKCNTDILEIKSLSCNHCVGDCELYESKKCSIYKENDQCFMRFDDTNSVVEMGCASEFTEQELSENARDFFLCDGDNCNDYPSLPKVNYCLYCNSNTNPDCASNPDKVTTATGCGTPPHSTCFSRINQDGSTERGCLMKLPVENFNECHTNSTSCNSCSGLYCNKEIFPADRPQCHRCDSSLDESCKSTPNALSACPVYKENEQCVTALDGETIIRGCASEVSCKGVVCKQCSGNGCNSIDIKVPEEGFPGLWQDLPLNCLKCEGEKCENGLETLSTCSTSNIYQNCLTIFGANGKVSKRGCSDDLETDCSSNPGNCLACKSSGCNNAVSQSDYVDCLFCDSKTDSSCKNEPAYVLKTRKCHKECMVALYSNLNNLEVVRSCLDDKDLDDRNTCSNGNDKNCESCTGDKCNVAILPKDDRISCLTCESDGCEIPEPQLCPYYKEDDKCFVKFESNEIVQMGCISSFEEELNEILKKKQVIVCDGENCNKDLLNNIPSAQTCQSCTSSNEVDCAIDPINLGHLTTCSHLPYPQCFVKVNKNGHTERGCLASLEGEEFLTCLNNNGSQCSSCVGANCNNKVFPESRLRCYQCNSNTDPNCGKDVQGHVCPIYSENESCVSSLVEGVTYRGCGSELQCDESDPKKCKVCKTNHCNIHDLEGEPEIPEPEVPEIGEPGLWQDLPLNCYKCEASNCDSKALLSKCDNNNLQVCTTVFGLNGSIEKRGCSDEVELTHSSYCKENPGKCISCKSNGCNLNNPEKDHIDCAFCDSEKDASCTIGSTGTTRKCHKSCMTALYPISLNDPNPAYALTRTCLDDKDHDDQESCNGEQCKQCSTENCNTEQLPETRLSCHHCNGNDCENPQPLTCARYRDNDVCFTLIDETNSVIQKGCGSNYMSTQIDDFLKTKKFYTCNTDNCNSFENIPQAKTCSLCNSKTDPFCATDPSNVSSKTKCDVQGYNQCYSRVLIDGHTERGCLSSLEGDEFVECLNNDSVTCKSCVGDTCNQEIYPEDRISCNTCSSDSDASCTSTPRTSETCLLYDQNQFCYSTLNGTTTIRGCGDESKCIGNKCNTCKGNNCNTIDFTGDSEDEDDVFGRFVPLPLNCYVCKENCSITLGVSETCQGRLRQDCITVFGENGEVVTRGCTDDVKNTQNTYCNQNPDKCYSCKSNECNIVWDTNEYVDCISCDSRKDVNCIDKADHFNTKKCYKTCLNALFPSIEKMQFDLHRGCLDDKDVLDQMLCNGETCEACTGPSCNNNVFPANRLQCHRCSPSDVDCALKPNHLQYCPTYVADDKCVTYFNGSSVHRGCFSELICESGDAQCNQCSGNGCNIGTEPGVTTPGVTTPEVTTPGVTTPGVTTPGVTTPGVTTPGVTTPGVTTPGVTTPGVTTPGVTTPEVTTPGVTTPEITTTPRPPTEGCFQCKGDTCEIPVAQKCKNLNDQCYVKYQGKLEIEEMGCKEDYENQEEIIDLIKQQKFYVCDGTNCNDIKKISTTHVCTVCNSETNENCAINLNTYFEKQTCGAPYSQCYSRILDNGHTQRGCLEDLKEEFYECLGNNDEKCQSCSGDLCNEKTYPENRLECEVCEGNCEKTSTKICTIFSKEKCFANFNDVGFPMRLGCSSDVEEGSLTEWENKKTLHECSGHSCNALDKLPQNEKCLVCESTDDVRCATHPIMLRNSKEETCYAPFNKCFVKIDGTTTVRGCLKDAGSDSEIENCENNVGQCSACSGSQCNDKVYPENRLSCYQCKDNEKCPLEQTAEQTSSVCPLYDGNDQCVAFYDKSEKLAIRDCASTNNLSCDTKDEKACQMCSGPLCNTKEVNGATGIVASMTALLIGVFITLRM